MEEDKQSFGLKKNINKAASIRNMCQTPGFAVLREEFESKITKITKKILDPDTTDKEVSELRQKVLLWTEIEKMLKTLMLTGELSKRALDQMDALDQTSPEVTDKEK